ncbi:unnamed protein product [Fraxinus pennsylvanica]|uniref:Zinc knuckle CX2CX4HX4C domain-containing protein n=1 Tax=Fraxinus pennsylvanica TaxID=56036 RepID=A0AAD2EAL7_9LAMI|nr:unnamed protein product [Fraxinus pennsylvanica]
MSRETGIKLGSSMGNVEDIEVDEDDVGWGSSLRVKIALNLRKPLARGRMVMLEGVKTWVPIQYEKLPWFCIKCGRIIHEQAGCPKSLDLNMGTKQYGSWLRAEVGNRKFRAFPTSGTKPPAMNFDTTEKKRVEEGGGHDGTPVPDVANQATRITVRSAAAPSSSSSTALFLHHFPPQINAITILTTAAAIYNPILIIFFFFWSE